MPVNQTQLEELDRSLSLVAYPESPSGRLCPERVLTSRLRGNDRAFVFIVFPAKAGIQDIYRKLLLRNKESGNT